METVTIPSSTAFLTSPNPKATVSKSNTKTNTKRAPSTAKASPKEKRKGDDTPKPKQSKSRNGCVTCKTKRLKCDETKPSCQQCLKRSVICGGYKKDFKWRPFEETNLTGKPTPTKTRRIPSSMPISMSTEHIQAPLASPALSMVSISTFSNDGTEFSDSFYDEPLPPTVPLSPNSSFHSQSFPTSVPSALYPIGTSQYSMMHNQPMNSSQMPQSDYPQSTNRSQPSGMLAIADLAKPTAPAPAPSPSGQSPRLIDLLLPGTDLNEVPPEYLDYRSQQSDHLYQSPLQRDFQTLNQDDDVEEIIREPEIDQDSWIIRLPSPSLTDSSGSSEGSMITFDPLSALYQQPRVLDGSPEMLMLRFDKQTCGILSVKDGPTENPWRALVWPLARESPALYHAIASMTAFHTSKEIPGMRMEGMEHMRQSIQSLASGINGMRTDTALATTLVLAFAESWDRHVSTGIEHLRGAKILVNQALVRHNQNSLAGDDLNRLRFLCNTWVYMDVIARLTNVDEDESNDFDNVLSPPCNFVGQSAKIDPLMGSASTLFPLIGRVANLIRRVRNSESNSVAVISQAMELKAAVEAWEASVIFETPEDPTCEIQHSSQTAEAYRWATLLYLHQAVPEIPSLTTAQLAKKVLVYLATVPLSSRAIIVQIYPLLAAGSEAVGHEDRKWVQDRWEAMTQRMLIGNVDRCWEVIKEVWDRRDAFEAERARRPPRLSKARTVPEESMPSESLGMKRKSNDHSVDWLDGSKRRATVGDMGFPSSTRVGHATMRSTDAVAEDMPYDMTVRGKLHWVGVMKDWEWEG
ncbi:MAG: hypothetical protein M1812_005169 [Candelaria pacifica]|nr:MAG: hypothetical protein M1812_005169 [Candelaria pacifica]